MKNKTKKTVYLLITLAIMVFIFVQSALPDYMSTEESNPFVVFIASVLEKTTTATINRELISFLVRKTAHFLEYMVLGVSLYLTVGEFLKSKREAGQRPEPQKVRNFQILSIVIPFLIGILYAATDEFHQLFVPGRFGSVKDVLIDGAGVLAGILIIRGILRKRNLSLNNRRENGIII